MVSFLHTSSTTTWSPFSHWRRHNINSKKPRAISYAYHILPHLKCTIKILTYYFINSKRKNGRGSPYPIKDNSTWGLGVGIEGVNTQPPSCPTSLGHADGEQKSALATLLYWHRARRCLGEETGSRNCRFLSVGVLCTVEQKSAIKIKKFN